MCLSTLILSNPYVLSIDAALSSASKELDTIEDIILYYYYVSPMNIHQIKYADIKFSDT